MQNRGQGRKFSIMTKGAKNVRPMAYPGNKRNLPTGNNSVKGKTQFGSCFKLDKSTSKYEISKYKDYPSKTASFRSKQ